MKDSYHTFNGVWQSPIHQFKGQEIQSKSKAMQLKLIVTSAKASDSKNPFKSDLLPFFVTWLF
jgi:hypothetical protein